MVFWFFFSPLFCFVVFSRKTAQFPEHQSIRKSKVIEFGTREKYQKEQIESDAKLQFLPLICGIHVCSFVRSFAFYCTKFHDIQCKSNRIYVGNHLQGYNFSRCVASNAYLFQIITQCLSFPTLQLLRASYCWCCFALSSSSFSLLLFFLLRLLIFAAHTHRKTIKWVSNTKNVYIQMWIKRTRATEKSSNVQMRKWENWKMVFDIWKKQKIINIIWTVLHARTVCECAESTWSQQVLLWDTRIIMKQKKAIVMVLWLFVVKSKRNVRTPKNAVAHGEWSQTLGIPSRVMCMPNWSELWAELWLAGERARLMRLSKVDSVWVLFPYNIRRHRHRCRRCSYLLLWLSPSSL